MVETVVAELGGLHIAVNNAGLNKNAAAEDCKEEDWDLTFDLNTKGVFLCCQVSDCTTALSPMSFVCSAAIASLLFLKEVLGKHELSSSFLACQVLGEAMCACFFFTKC